MRSISPAPPFSTTSPSGVSLPEIGVPPLLLTQKSFAGQPVPAGSVPPRVQKLTALGEMKPVAVFTASLFAESAREMAPDDASSLNLYSFRFPIQRGLPPPSGRNMPM